MCSALPICVCVKYFIQLFFHQSFCLFLFHVHISVYECVCAHFLALGLLFKLNEKTHTHTDIQTQNWMTPIRIRSMGNERFSVRFLLLLLLKNSFMIYDLLSIMRTLSLSVGVYNVQVYCIFHRRHLDFDFFLSNFLALWDRNTQHIKYLTTGISKVIPMNNKNEKVPTTTTTTPFSNANSFLITHTIDWFFLSSFSSSFSLTFESPSFMYKSNLNKHINLNF